jgi:predicted ATP-grasp superfamily ATP-dependent carboligase
MAARQAGYKVTAIDGFADQQTVAAAEMTIVVNYDEYGFDAEALLAAVAKLDASRYLGFVYGSGFETQPDLLERIAALIPLIGNSALIVGAINAPDSFFSALARGNILCPKVYKELPGDVDSKVYLKKLVGGCGGTHISFANVDSGKSCNQYYYQQFVSGQSVSLLFVSNSRTVEVIGFNEQWLSQTEMLPFRYGGAVSNVELSQAVKQQLITAAEKITVTFGLLGLNSLDAVVNNGLVYVLEINPRLSASFDLYEADKLYEANNVALNLMNVHIQASHAAELLKFKAATVCKAHAVVYAISDIVIASTFSWPAWVLDIPLLISPQKEIRLLAGEPICTVMAQAESAEKSKQLIDARLAEIQQLLS